MTDTQMDDLRRILLSASADPARRRKLAAFLRAAVTVLEGGAGDLDAATVVLAEVSGQLDAAARAGSSLQQLAAEICQRLESAEVTVERFSLSG